MTRNKKRPVRTVKATPKKQTTRMIKVVCSCSKYTVRMSRMWINDVGCPGCAVCGVTMVEAS